MISIFTCPKAFEGHIDLIQRNAIRSWKALAAQVEIILVGDERGVRSVAREFDVVHVGEVERNQMGTPLVSSVFKQARQRARHRLLCYVNADILLLDDFLPAVDRVTLSFEKFLVVGGRWDVDVAQPLEFDEDGQEAVHALLSERGSAHPPSGSDYFVFTSEVLNALPSFAVGRPGWDNWMIYAGRRAGLPTIDATDAITAVHQNHDYAHLKDREVHYGSPEHLQNLALGGGQKRMFNLIDCDWQLASDGLQRPRLTPRRLLRALVVWPILSERWSFLEGPMFALVHPVAFLKLKLHALLAALNLVRSVDGSQR